MRAGSVLLCVVVVLGVVAVPGAATPPDDGRLTVTDVTVTPANPTVDDTVSFDVALRNSAGSPDAVDVRNVSLRTADGERVAFASDLGTLSQGDTLTVPVTTTFDTPGEKDLVLVATGLDEDDNETVVRRPVSVFVEQAPPQLSTAFEAAVDGVTTNLTVDLSNPRTTEVRNLTVAVEGEGVTTVDGRATVPDLDPGESVSVPLAVRPESPGVATLELTLSYTTVTGRTATTNVTRTLSVAEADRDVGVRVEPTDDDDAQAANPAGVQQVLGGGSLQSDDDDENDNSGPGTVSVTVTNFGNAPATEVVLVPTGTDRLERRSVATALAPGESASVTVDLSGVRNDTTVGFRVEYRMAGAEGSAATTYEVSPAPVAVELTGLNLSLDEDGKLALTGNVGNLGEREVTGVVVEVGANTYAEPAYPQRSYFVGSIAGSEFAPFELTADVDPNNVSTVPVRVRYTVDGTERKQVVQVPFSADLRVTEQQSRLPDWSMVGLAGLAAVLPAGWFVVRRYREP